MGSGRVRSGLVGSGRVCHNRCGVILIIVIYRRYYTLTKVPVPPDLFLFSISILQQPTVRDLFVKEKSRKEKRSSQKGGGHSEEEEGEGEIAAQEEMMVASSKDDDQPDR